MARLRITGQRGSWFAKVEKRDHRLPIMWADEMQTQNKRLTTNWLQNGLEHTAHKRQEFLEYFKPLIDEQTEFVLARAVDPTVLPREMDGYIGVFSGCVLATDPEIDIEVLSRVADAR